MKHSACLLIFCLGLASSGPALAETEPEWKLRKDKAGIQVYTRKVAGSPHAEVRATTILQGVRLSSMVALLDDVDACPEWANKCAESYVQEKVSDTESYVYTHNTLPFPVKDRDIVAHVNWSQDSDSMVVEMKSVATTGRLEKVKKRVRLTQANILWRFKPLPTGDIEVTNQAHVNPGSGMPAWFTNKLLVGTPYRTMQSFADAVRWEKYENATLSFIQEPPAP